MRRKGISLTWGVLISVIIAGVSMVFVPWFIEKISSVIYKKVPFKVKEEETDDDDWGPEIVRKEDLK